MCIDKFTNPFSRTTVQMDIQGYLESEKKFTLFAKVLRERQFDSRQKYTILAVTNDAFQDYALVYKGEDPGWIERHILRGEVVLKAPKQAQLKEYPRESSSLSQTPLKIWYNPGTSHWLGGDHTVQIPRANGKLRNGVVHEVDAVVTL